MPKFDYVILCEKASQARNYAKAMGGMSGTIGFGQLKGSSFAICNAIGHLFNLMAPESQVNEAVKDKYSYPWEVEKLPWVVSDLKWRLKLDPDKKDAFEKIKDLFGKTDNIIIATDNDSSGEGGLLAGEIIIEAGANGKKHLYRSLHSDESVKEIQKAIDNLVDYGHDITKTDEYCKANFRRKFDYLLGMQETQLATVLAGDNLLRWGRLKSFILSVCYKQQQLIDNYVEIPYWQNRFKDENGVIYIDENEPKVDSQAKVVGNYHPSAVVLDKKEQKASVPPLFKNLDQIASALASKYPGKLVESTYQKMYEAGIVSYPRTDDKKITLEQWNEFNANADAIARVVGIDPAKLTRRTPRNTHLATGMSHGANRPGATVPASLSALKTQFGDVGADIYDFIAHETLTIFAEDYLYEHQTGHLKDYPTFKGSTNVAKSMGWRAIFNDDFDPDAAVGLGSTAEPFIYKGTNPKPAALTRTWLTKQMEKANVGTGATRLSTVNELSSESSKNPPLKDTRGRLSLTNWGKLSGVLLENTKISELDFTKNTYHQMDDVFHNHHQDIVYLNEIQNIINHDIAKVKENVGKIKIVDYTGSEKGVAIGVCPACGGKIYEHTTKFGKTLWSCENSGPENKTCNFVIYDKQKYFKDTLPMTGAKVKKLLDGKAVSFNLTAMSGKKYAWDMKLSVNGAGYPQFDKIGFTEKKSKK